MSSKRWLAALAAALSVAVSGCAERIPAAEMGFTHPVWTDDGLYLVEQRGPGALFLATSQLNLDRYSGIIVEDIEFAFKQRVREFDARERERTAALIGRNALRMLSPQGWQRTHESGPGTLRMRIAITQIDYRPITLYGASSAVVVPSGGAAITLELSDSIDDRRLLVYAQHRELPFNNYGGPGRINAERVADAFYEFALDLARFVAKAERGEFPGPGTQVGLSLTD